MLPKTLYKSLPYLYIFIGAFVGLNIESRFVLFSSALLMMAGFIVLWMRHSKHGEMGVEALYDKPMIRTRDWEEIFQADQERRRSSEVRAFPLLDNNGNVVPFDRRVNGRSVSNAA